MSCRAAGPATTRQGRSLVKYTAAAEGAAESADSVAATSLSPLIDTRSTMQLQGKEGNGRSETSYIFAVGAHLGSLIKDLKEESASKCDESPCCSAAALILTSSLVGSSIVGARRVQLSEFGLKK
jgi:hypothetical protein